MRIKLFGEFLVEQGEIDKNQLETALHLIDSGNPTIGNLAVRMGLLNADQALEINHRQRYTNQRFGELAIEMGLLTPDELENLLYELDKGVVPLGEALVGLGFLAPHRLDPLLSQHAEERRLAYAESPAAGSLSEHPLALTVLELFPKVVRRVARLKVRISPGESFSGDLEFPHNGAIELLGERPLHIILNGDREFAETITCSIAHLAVEDFKATTIDEGMQEFLTVLAGNALQDGDTGAFRIANAADPEQRGANAVLFRIAASRGNAALVLSE